MEALPTELRRQILSNCTPSTLKSLRLTCHTWATIGFEYLLTPTFTTLPHRPDFARLLAVSQVPLFSQRLETLSIKLGEINEYHARHNSYFVQYMRDPDDRLAAQEQTWGAYAAFRDEKGKYMPSACSRALLEPALKKLPNLRTVEVSLATCPFPEIEEMELLRQIWNIPSTRLLPRASTMGRFKALLAALAASPATISELSHDRLPLEYFQQHHRTISIACTVFKPLTSLSLTLDYADTSHGLDASPTFHNLCSCLRSATLLQCMNLSFQSTQQQHQQLQKIDISALFSSLSCFSLPLPSPSSFSSPSFNPLTLSPNPTFPALHALKLEGIACTENALVAFLAPHRHTLRRLQLGGEGVRAPHQRANGGVRLLEGTWRGLVGRLRECLDLEGEGLVVQGDLVEGERRLWVRDEPWIVESLEGLELELDGV